MRFLQKYFVNRNWSSNLKQATVDSEGVTVAVNGNCISDASGVCRAEENTDDSSAETCAATAALALLGIIHF